MKTISFVLTLLTSLLLIASCKKDDLCEKATLYYTPSCSTIMGYVTLNKNNETLVFQHDIDPEFRASGVNVCITYDNEEDKPLTAECTMGKIIKITYIEER